MENSKKLRIELVGVLNKWIRAFQDDVLAEESAIALYQSHIDDFDGNFHIDLPDLFPILEKIGFSNKEADKIWKMLREMAKGKDKSIQHIINEEKEHIEEFTEMINKLKSLINDIKKLDKE